MDSTYDLRLDSSGNNTMEDYFHDPTAAQPNNEVEDSTMNESETVNEGMNVDGYNQHESVTEVSVRTSETTNNEQDMGGMEHTATNGQDLVTDTNQNNDEVPSTTNREANRASRPPVDITSDASEASAQSNTDEPEDPEISEFVREFKLLLKQKHQEQKEWSNQLLASMKTYLAETHAVTKVFERLRQLEHAESARLDDLEPEVETTIYHLIPGAGGAQTTTNTNTAGSATRQQRSSPNLVTNFPFNRSNQAANPDMQLYGKMTQSR